MCKLLGARNFVVFQTNGKKPFFFYEIDVVTKEVISENTLDYDDDRKKEAWLNFWRNVLKIK